MCLGIDQPSATLELFCGRSDVPLARQFAAGVSEALGLDPAGAEDAKLAISEACTNVVLHAYGGEDGPVRIHACVEENAVVFAVRDFSEHGFSPQSTQPGSGGFGLALIRATSDGFSIGPAEGRGSRVEMRFERHLPAAVDPAPPSFAPVLRRVLALMAAQEEFSMDRLSDAVLVAETLWAHGRDHVLGGTMRVTIDRGETGLAIKVGPLPPGGAAHVLTDSDLPVLGSVLERLADSVSVIEPGPDDLGEQLVLGLGPGR